MGVNKKDCQKKIIINDEKKIFMYNYKTHTDFGLIEEYRNADVYA